MSLVRHQCCQIGPDLPPNLATLAATVTVAMLVVVDDA